MGRPSKISDLTFDPKNARVRTARGEQMIRDSLQEVGAARSIVIDENGVILAGNGTVEAAGQVGIENLKIIEASGDEIVAVRRKGLTDEQKKKLAYYDNRTGDAAEWDMEQVASDLADGYDFLEDLFDNIQPFVAEEGGDDAPDPAEELRQKWGVEYGDLWAIGEHRILCGDSTKKEDAEMLMDGRKATMCHTDPPYNVDYGSTKNPRHKIRSIENDSMGTGEWQSFVAAFGANIKEFTTGDVYVWGAPSPEGMRMRLWLVEMGLHWSATICWKKQQLVLSPTKYQRMYEPCLYGWFGDKSSFSAGRKETEVWEVDRPHDSKLHPTMKPLELCQIAIRNSSQGKDIVLDLFNGSGSTMVAAHNEGRTCYAMEIDPAYVAVCLERMAKLGYEPEKLDA